MVRFSRPHLFADNGKWCHVYDQGQAMDFGGFDSFGGDKPGGHRPTTAGERAVLVWLARLVALLLMAVGFGGALFITDPDRLRAFLVVGSLGVFGLLVLWFARRLDLI